MSRDGPPIGLDFGSQNLRAYVWKNGRVQQVPGAGFQSIVALGDHLMTGRDAVKELETRHCNVVRHICASLNSRRPVVFQHPLGPQRQLAIDELAAALLDVQRLSAHAYLQGDISKATVALPLALTSLERERLSAAALSAGLTRLQLVPSSAMAAVYWAHCTRVLGTYDARREFLVVDAGCRYTSVSVVRTYCGSSPHHLKVELLESRAITEGGYGADLAMASNLLRASGKVLDVQLVNAAEKAKKELSFLKETTLQVKEFNTTVNRENLEAASAMVMGPLKALIRSVVLKVPSVTTALLIGGASRLPQLHEFVKSLRIQPDIVDSDYAAVMGAAIASGIDMKIDVIDVSHTYEYWVCDRAPGNMAKQVFIADNGACLDKPDDVWFVCQRLKSSLPSRPPTQYDFLQACVVPPSAPPPSVARTDGICDDEGDVSSPMRAPRFFLPEIPAAEVQTVHVNTRGETNLGLQLREMETHLVVAAVAIGSPAAREGLERFTGWFLHLFEDSPIYTVQQLEAGCANKRSVSLTFQAPEDHFMERELVFIGMCYGGVLKLNPSGIVSGLHPPGDLVMGRDRVESTRKMLKKEKDRKNQMKQLGEVRNDLDEALIRGGDGVHPSSLNRICSKAEVLLNLAAELLSSVTTVDRKKRKAKLQLNRMGTLAKVLLHVLDLHEDGKIASERLAHFEIDYERATAALEAYNSDEQEPSGDENRLKRRSKTFHKSAPLRLKTRSGTIQRRPSISLGSSLKNLSSSASPERHTMVRLDLPVKTDSPTSPHNASMRSNTALLKATSSRKSIRRRKSNVGRKRGSLGEVSGTAWVDSDGSDYGSPTVPKAQLVTASFGDEVDSSSSSEPGRKGSAVPRAVKDAGKSKRMTRGDTGSLSSTQMSPLLSGRGSGRHLDVTFPQSPTGKKMTPTNSRAVSPRAFNQPVLTTPLSRKTSPLHRASLARSCPEFRKELSPLLAAEADPQQVDDWEPDRASPLLPERADRLDRASPQLPSSPAQLASPTSPAHVRMHPMRTVLGLVSITRAMAGGSGSGVGLGLLRDSPSPQAATPPPAAQQVNSNLDDLVELPSPPRSPCRTRKPEVEITTSSPPAATKRFSNKRSSPSSKSSPRGRHAASPGRQRSDLRSLSATRLKTNASTPRRMSTVAESTHSASTTGDGNAETGSSVQSPDRRKSLVPRVAGLTRRPSESHLDVKSLHSPSSRRRTLTEEEREKEREKGHSDSKGELPHWAPALRSKPPEVMLLTQSLDVDGLHINTTKVKEDAKNDALKAIQRAAERFAVTQAERAADEAKKKAAKPNEKMTKLLLAKRERRKLETGPGKLCDDPLNPPSLERRTSPVTPRSTAGFSVSGTSLCSTVESPMSSMKGTSHTIEPVFDCHDGTLSRGTVPEKLKRKNSRKCHSTELLKNSPATEPAAEPYQDDDHDTRTDDAVDEEEESTAETPLPLSPYTSGMGLTRGHSACEAREGTPRDHDDETSENTRRIVTEPRLVRRKTDDNIGVRVRSRTSTDAVRITSEPVRVVSARKRHPAGHGVGAAPSPPPTITHLQSSSPPYEGHSPKRVKKVERKRVSQAGHRSVPPLLANSVSHHNHAPIEKYPPPPGLSQTVPLVLHHEIDDLEATRNSKESGESTLRGGNEREMIDELRKQLHAAGLPNGPPAPKQRTVGSQSARLCNESTKLCNELATRSHELSTRSLPH